YLSSTQACNPGGDLAESLNLGPFPRITILDHASSSSIGAALMDKRSQTWLAAGRGRGAASLAVCATCGVMILGGCAFEVYRQVHKPVPFSVDPEATPFWGPAEVNTFMTRFVGTFDAKGQSLAHRVALLALGSLVVSAPALRRLLPT